MTPTDGAEANVDVVVVGAGFAGMYLLHRLRGLGFSTRVLEAGTTSAARGTGTATPVPDATSRASTTPISFDADLDAEWQWSEKYAAAAGDPALRPARRRTARFAPRHRIRLPCRLGRVGRGQPTLDGAHSQGESDQLPLHVMATGCLSMPKEVDIAGTDRFAGEVYFTSRWPHRRG